MDETLMTLQDVAKYLRMNVMTIYRYSKKGVIKGTKVGGQWRFKKEWIEELFKKM